MANSPERSVLHDVLSAHQLAGKIHADGAKPLTRLGGAAAITATGVALEMISSGSTKLIQDKFPSIQFDKLPPLFRELLEDGVVGVTYAIANKQLNEPLPKLKLRHLTTSTLGTILVSGVEGVGGKVSGKLQEWKMRGEKKMDAKPVASSSTADGSTQASADATIQSGTLNEDPKKAPPQLPNAMAESTLVPSDQTETKKSLLDYINPVTALGADEARLAVMDWYRAYKAVEAGTQEEFVKTNKPKDPKEPTLTRETTTIYIVPDMASASAMVNTTTSAVATS